MEVIHIAQIDPWAFISQGMSVKKHDGREISYSGIAFSGSPEQIFWSRYIEPFLEELTQKQYNETIKLALEKEVDARLALAETRELLLSVSRKTYRRMSDIDQRLRGNGFPDSVTPRVWEPKYEKMRAFIEEHYRSELAMLKQPSRMERWYARNKALTWILGIFSTACVGAAVKALVGA